ncbi:MAG TPA: LuxR C-terminal-related transcriptional regulator [Polyangiales bacterium]|nr:LuxR C-terminal-related transcriptional regulator [Polyangiales bacterium]
MSSAPRDPIAFVEACYDLHVGELEWLRAIAEAARPLMRARTVIAYHVDFTQAGLRIEHGAAQFGDGDGDVAARITAMGACYDRCRNGTAGVVDRLKYRLHEKGMRAQVAEAADRLLLSEIKTPVPRWVYTLGVPGIRDLFFMLNHHVDGNGLTYVVGSLPERGELRPAERAMFLRLGAHLKAGFRLRRRLPDQLRSLEAPEHGAVLDGAGALVHAEGDARDPETRALLAQRAREIDQARTRSGGRDERALEVWQGLVNGRWSLVERFDADGKRFMLAHKNPETITDPRGLTELEARVARLAVRGYSDKLIAYHLGVAEGTVSSQLSRALRKLGIDGRVDLVRLFGPGNSFESLAPSSKREPAA